jgi:hypothetical protein
MMGTTAARLHLRTPDLLDPMVGTVLAKAYAKLGWAPPRRGVAATRQVQVARHGGFLTLLDSDCAALDDGTLRELAALLSRQIQAPALVTGVQDSDSFELLVYDSGRQVDALGAAAEGPDAAKTLRGAKQATLWIRLFGATADDTAARFAARAQEIATADSAFAEDILGAWCALAHLPGAALAELPAAGDGLVAELALARRGSAATASTAAAATPQASLRYHHSEDDCPYHGFHPAAWPCAGGSAEGFRWPVVCAGGLQGLSIRLALRRSGAFRLTRVACVALPFHNGQVTSMTPLASWEATLDAAAATAGTLDFAAPDFVVRAPAPGSRAQAILLLRLGFDTPEEGEVVVEPTLATGGTELPLPPLTLRATRPAWRPRVAPPGELEPAQQEALLRLAAPSIHHAVAVIADEAGPRAAIRGMAEAALATCTAQGLELVVATEKHMTESGNVTKGAREMPLAGAFAEKAWARLFDAASDLQMVSIGLRRPGDPWPLAGLGLHGNLRDTLLGGGEDATLTVSLWAIAAPAAEAALGLDRTRFLAPFLAWARGAAPRQGWVGEAAWIPSFDTYNDYAFTPFEVLGTTPHSRMRLHGSHEAADWLGGRLRFVAPRLWLGPELLGRLDRAALAAAAEIAPAGAALEVTLRPGAGIAALEQALEPVLPVAR